MSFRLRQLYTERIVYRHVCQFWELALAKPVLITSSMIARACSSYVRRDSRPARQGSWNGVHKRTWSVATVGGQL